MSNVTTTSRLTTLAALVAASALVACSSTNLGGGSKGGRKDASNSESKKSDGPAAPEQPNENEGADEPMQVSGAFLVECGIAGEQDAPEEADAGWQWIGCGVIDPSGGRPAHRPPITRIDATYGDGSGAALALIDARPESMWDKVATVPTDAPGGIAQLDVSVENYDATVARIVGPNDRRYGATLGQSASGSDVPTVASAPAPPVSSGAPTASAPASAVPAPAPGGNTSSGNNNAASAAAGLFAAALTSQANNPQQTGEIHQSSSGQGSMQQSSGQSQQQSSPQYVPHSSGGGHSGGGHSGGGHSGGRH